MANNQGSNNNPEKDINVTNYEEELEPENVHNSQVGPNSNDQPGTSQRPPTIETRIIKRTRSEPNRLRQCFRITTTTAPLNDDGAERKPKNASKFSLKFKSEVFNVTNKSNVTLRSCIRFKDDASETRQTLPAQSSSNEFNAEITVLYSDQTPYTSSESLIAKDSMGYSSPITTQPMPKSSTTIGPIVAQPPPYHIATAHDTASVQLTPASSPPLVLYSAPPSQGAPPTYSALMRIGPRNSSRHFNLFSRRDIQIQPSAPFIAPPPPPTYAQAQGFCVAHPLQFSDMQDSIWGSEPVTLICQYCNNFIVTTVRFRRSNLTHYSALALCICGCWPCCLLPYCMKSCKSAEHDCPICGNVVGIYSPWQVA